MKESLRKTKKILIKDEKFSKSEEIPNFFLGILAKKYEKSAILLVLPFQEISL